MKIPVRKSVSTLIAVVCLLSLCAIIPACQTESPPESSPESGITPLTVSNTDISVSELKDKLENDNQLLLVDVRTEAEYSSMHIKGAVSIPLNEIPDRYGEIPRDIEVIVYSGCA